MTDGLLKTPLYAFHRAHGAKMVAFAGYDMPVQYADGVLKEHLHTREKAGLFDVSHMGQASLFGPDHETVAAALETVAPAELRKLGPGRQRYTVLLNDAGGTIDDLIVARPGEADGRLDIVVNASRKEIDYERIADALPGGVRLERYDDRALLALQGPAAADVLAAHAPQSATLKFMNRAAMDVNGVPAQVARAGYTGEDGFEISVPADAAEARATALLEDGRVKPIGLGARDSLRLEAGLCLYGNDLDETTTPVEAGVSFAIGKRRRETGDFPGAAKIRAQLACGPERALVGLRPDGRAPARAGVEILDPEGVAVGVVTSGGFGPTVGGPIALGYVKKGFEALGTRLALSIRGKAEPAAVVETPFTPHRYFRG
ncbi:MAG: glycine cleavage system aminomethyltransferase GcvT [Parvularculaceae bacterium]